MNNCNWPNTVFFHSKLSQIPPMMTHMHSQTNWKKNEKSRSMTLSWAKLCCCCFSISSFMLSQLPACVWFDVYTYTSIHSFLHSFIRSGTLPTFQFHLLLFITIYEFSILPFSQLVSVFGLLHRNINNKLRKKRIFPLFEHEIGSYGKKSR